MMPPVQFVVVGTPAPQGSKVPFKDKQGNARMKEASAATLTPWRSAVAAAAQVQREACGYTFDGPLKVTAQFRLPMPRSRPVWARTQGMLPSENPPDLDKLMRALGDSMKQGGLVKDDARFAIEHLSKIEVWDAWTGVVVRVQALDPRAFRGELL